MKSKKLSLKVLSVKSFVTSIESKLSKTVKGGSNACTEESYYCLSGEYYCTTTDDNNGTNSNKIGCKWTVQPTGCNCNNNNQNNDDTYGGHT